VKKGDGMNSHADALVRLRQVALVARDLDPVVEMLCDVFGVEVAYRDPGVEVFGLRNAVMPLGQSFLEVVSPDRIGTTAGRLLERRGGDGGYMVIVQSQARKADRARVESLGVRIAWEAAQGDAATLHLHPRDIGGAILSLDWMDPPESWRWAGPRWREVRRSELVTGIAGVEIQAQDPAAMARRWGEVLAQPARRVDDALVIELPDGGSIRFVAERDGRGEGVSGLLVAAADPESVRRRARVRGVLRDDGTVILCGVRISLVGVRGPERAP
jgi:catechol 2,3-dioxygenase-like lactoylglutathione lyase family enzyme